MMKRRDIKSYDEHVALLMKNKVASYGSKAFCCLQELTFYHSATNDTCDIIYWRVLHHSN